MSHFLAKVGSCWNWAAVLLTLSNVAMGRCGSFVAVDGKRLERLTSDAGFPGVPGVYRNGAGTELFLTGRMPDNTTLVKIVSRDGMSFKRYPSGRAVVGEYGELVARVTNYQAAASAAGVVKALAFSSGEAIPIVFTNGFPARFEFSSGAEYFLLDQTSIPAAMLPGWTSAAQPVLFLTPGAMNMGGYSPRWQAVFRTTSPTQPLFRLPSDFYANGIFTRGGWVIVSGFKYTFREGSKSGRPEVEKQRAWVLFFSEEVPTWKLTSQLDLSRFNGVLDVDPTSGMLLVQGKGDLFAKWGLFDPGTDNFKSLGHVGAHGFFLDAEFSKYLESRWK